jgi:hypothetical protein
MEDFMREEKKVLNWHKILKNFEETNLAVNEFCRRNKVKPSRFYYWKKRLSYKAKTATDKNISTHSFITIEEKSSANITFIIAGHEISFSELPEPAWIAKFTKELSHESPAS